MLERLCWGRVVSHLHRIGRDHSDVIRAWKGRLMDQLDRGARMCLNERRARERLVEDERERDRRYLIAEFDDEADRRRLYATAIMVALVLLVILYGLTRHMSADGSAWGTATDASTLVQPPSWWLTKE